MRRSITFAALLLFACPSAPAADAGRSTLALDGLVHTELTEAFKPHDELPPSAPLSAAQQAFLAQAQQRFLELVEADHLPRPCEGAPSENAQEFSTLKSSALPGAQGQLDVTFLLTAQKNEWTGSGCCVPCAQACGPCGYCAPADACLHFATERQLVVSYAIDANGRVRSEQVVRRASDRHQVTREVIKPAPAPVGVSLQLGDIQASGGLDANRLTAFLRSRAQVLRRCAAFPLPHGGTFSVSFVITPAGRSADLESVENTLGNELVPSCVKALMRGLVFPLRPAQNASVVLPITVTTTADQP